MVSESRKVFKMFSLLIFSKDKLKTMDYLFVAFKVRKAFGKASIAKS